MSEVPLYCTLTIRRCPGVIPHNLLVLIKVSRFTNKCLSLYQQTSFGLPQGYRPQENAHPPRTPPRTIGTGLRSGPRGGAFSCE